MDQGNCNWSPLFYSGLKKDTISSWDMIQVAVCLVFGCGASDSKKWPSCYFLYLCPTILYFVGGCSFVLFCFVLFFLIIIFHFGRQCARKYGQTISKRTAWKFWRNVCDALKCLCLNFPLTCYLATLFMAFCPLFKIKEKLRHSHCDSWCLLYS